MRRRYMPLLTLFLLTGAWSVATGLQRADSIQEQVLTTWSHAISDSIGEFYEPVESHFRIRFELDRRNAARQRWIAYWRWVRTFYRGNLLDRGWDAHCDRVLASLPDDHDRDGLIARMNVLGRLIAAEWSKDNSVRTISTRDLNEWGRRMRKAIRDRNGDDPAPIMEVWRIIEREVYRRILPVA